MKIKLNLSLFLSFCLVVHNANAFNITHILNQYPDFSTFNNYLTQTNLASQINSRQTITVLAVENSNLSPISGRPPQILTNILSVHVILDYFDVPKLENLPNRPTLLTTLFQTSGLARGQQGFVNVTHLSTSSIAFGSAVAGSTPGSNLVKSVFSQPYNISVLQVSNAIVPPGVGGPTNSPAPAGAPSTGPGGAHAPVPASAPSGGGSQTPSMSPSVSPPVAPPTSGGAPAPSEVPPSTGVITPPAAAPGSPPVPAAADAPAADGPAAGGPSADAPASDPPSEGRVLHIGAVDMFIVVASTLCLATRI